MNTQPKLPIVIEALVAAQNSYNSTAFAELFSPDAIVHDEGKTHTGTLEIKQWNEATNDKYRVTLEPKIYKSGILAVSVSGNFDGSPALLHYHFTFEDDKIKTLGIK
jgi:hypothetical protein